MGKHVYTGLSSEINGQPVKPGDAVELSDAQVEALRAHGHTFKMAAVDEQKPSPQEVDAAFDVKSGEADLSKASKAEKK